MRQNKYIGMVFRISTPNRQRKSGESKLSGVHTAENAISTSVRQLRNTAAWYYGIGPDLIECLTGKITQRRLDFLPNIHPVKNRGKLTAAPPNIYTILT